MIYSIYLILSYLVGALPFGQIFSRIKGNIDLQRVGSGNIGATNVARTLGIKWGLLTLLCDIGKGASIVFVALHLIKDTNLAAFAGIVAVLGHCYPVYLKFKGGKGVATACGAFMVINPAAVSLAVIIFIIIMLITRMVSLSSLIAALNFPVLSSYLGASKMLVYGALVVALIITYRHKENIKKLIHGQESQFSFKKKN